MQTAETTTPPSANPIELVLSEHGISCILPAGSRFVGDLDVPNGALIMGEVIGNINCRDGSLILEPRGHIRGVVVADRIYVRGRVTSGNSRSQLVGRTLVNVREGSEVTADVYTGAPSIAPSAFNGTIHTVEEFAAATDVPGLISSAMRPRIAADGAATLAAPAKRPGSAKPVATAGKAAAASVAAPSAARPRAKTAPSTAAPTSIANKRATAAKPAAAVAAAALATAAGPIPGKL
jgi:cytoskeletal protein CcmA (bactofilin family)